MVCAAGAAGFSAAAFLAGAAFFAGAAAFFAGAAAFFAGAAAFLAGAAFFAGAAAFFAGAAAFLAGAAAFFAGAAAFLAGAAAFFAGAAAFLAGAAFFAGAAAFLAAGFFAVAIIFSLGHWIESTSGLRKTRSDPWRWGPSHLHECSNAPQYGLGWAVVCGAWCVVAWRCVNPRRVRRPIGTRSRGFRRSCVPSSGRSFRSSTGTGFPRGGRVPPVRSAGHGDWRCNAGSL